MSKHEGQFYEFGPFRLVPDERLLLRDGEPVALTPKAFETLVALVHRAGHLADKDELLKEVWPDSFVEESNLTQNVFALRKVLGEGKKGPKYIETVPKRGYRFLASVRVVEDLGKELVVRQHVRGGAGGATTPPSDDTIAPFYASAQAAVTRVTSVDASDAVTPHAPTSNETRAATVTLPETTTAEIVQSVTRWHRRRAFLLLAVLLLAVAAGGYGIYRLVNREKRSAVSLQGAKWTRLTTSGKVMRAAISPDGRFVVHVVDEAGQQSLWVKQIATQSNIEKVAPAAVSYQSLSFTPDGDYIYYTLESKDFQHAVLYQVPTLGGDPKRIPVKLDPAATDMPHRPLVSFSPDGKRFVFSRSEGGKETALIIANADGGGEQKLVTHRSPEVCGWPSWSPDGKTIAYTLGNFDSNDMTVFLVRVSDGGFNPLTSKRWFRAGRMVWLADGSGLLILATAGNGNFHQIWQLSFPAGDARLLTNNLNNYVDLSLTDDSSTLAAVQFGEQGNIWVTPAGDITRARQITSGAGLIEGAGGISWTPDGRIVYSSRTSDGRDIWIIDADGKNQKQLTLNRRINNQPAVSPDGRHIFFLSDRTGVPHIWRMDLDGGNQSQSTNGAGEQSPSCSPDGRWVLYMTVFGEPSIWKVPADGGQPVQLSDKLLRYPSVSPDGQQVACLFSENDNAPPRLAIVPFEGGQPLKTFDVGANYSKLYWMPDGRAITYVDTRNGVSNVVVQSLDGGAPKPLTDFKSDIIFAWELSRDGKQLVLSRGIETRDVIIISNFRMAS
jgi:Tol biopolymer transport system component/DNA-binding winged helix-turn-helix (wHTH) protein